MCKLYMEKCEEFLASHFDFLCSLKSGYDKMFDGMFMGCGVDMDYLSRVVHMPISPCVHKVEDLYFKEIEYIDLHQPSCNARAAVNAWKDNENIQASSLALYMDGDEDAARSWLSSTERCRLMCPKDECKCLRDMSIVDGMVSWKRRYKFDQ